MSRLVGTQTVPGANSSSSWEWCPGDTSEEKEEAPTASVHGDTTARIASLLAFSAAMKNGKHSTPCEMLCDSRGRERHASEVNKPHILPACSTTTARHALALNLEASEAKDLVQRSTAYPKARIDHGRAGDDILMRYHRKHGTFAGAEVYVKPNIDNAPAVPAQSSSSTQSHYPTKSLVE